MSSGDGEQCLSCAFFEPKKIKLITRTLTIRACVVREYLLGALLPLCTVIGVVAQMGKTTRMLTEHTRLMATVFSNLNQYFPVSGIRSISLRVTAPTETTDGELIAMHSFRPQRNTVNQLVGAV